MTIKIGDFIPETMLRVVTDEGAQSTKASAFFASKRWVLFGVPGAFTPTCHSNHLPGFLAAASDFKAKGVEGIAVVAVNDPHVLKAWRKATEAGDKITFLADGSADFAKASGLDVDLSAGGLGIRNHRFSMLIEDGKVKLLNIEDSPGKAEASSAQTLLAQM